MLDEMTASATAVVREAGVAGPVTAVRTADLRYAGQGYDLGVTLPEGPVGAETKSALQAAFAATYARRYGYADAGAAIELTAVGVTVTGAGPAVTLAEHRPETTAVADARKPGRRVYFPESRDFIPCPVYDRGRLPVGARLAGPAIVEEAESTTVLPPGVTAAVDRWASLLVSLAGVPPWPHSPARE
jgi:N-methylhydantoinase A